MALIHEIYHALKVHFSRRVIIREVPFTSADNEAMRSYAEEGSDFDGPANLRRNAWQNATKKRHYMTENGDHLFVAGPATPSAKLLDVMAHVICAMHARGRRPYRIYWFMSDAKRRFPNRHSIKSSNINNAHTVGPINVNGGYCRACAPDTIVIYRREDALRVLIHELQHAGCLDDHSMPTPQLEAHTEAWAELIYAMVGAVVHHIKPEEAWRIQTAWSAAQNRRLRDEFGVTGPAAYAWRYTVGKEEVWRAMDLPVSGGKKVTESLQLGAPQLDVT